MSVKIVAIGDSITYGFPYSPRESWVSLAFSRLGHRAINLGENGATTGEMRARFASQVLVEKPTHVIIMGGTNDAFYNLPVELVCNNIDRMCEEARAERVMPIIGLPIPVNEAPAEAWLQTYRSWLRGYAARMNYPLLDFYTALVDPQTGWLVESCHEDGVHPSLEGYRRMAQLVLKEFNEHDFAGTFVPI
ncbi:MAG TPA: GDSL-type esterase/lipase family protein [Bacillota bacterium]|nr:GDSL-type esterase/lipase family protein [Bacillota bacterium]